MIIVIQQIPFHSIFEISYVTRKSDLYKHKVKNEFDEKQNMNECLAYTYGKRKQKYNVHCSINHVFHFFDRWVWQPFIQDKNNTGEKDSI